MAEETLITGMTAVPARAGLAALSSPAVVHPRSGAKAREASVGRDLSRRLLLADDGKLSLEEFQSYFTDGILTEEQMQELYYSIDRQRTK